MYVVLDTTFAKSFSISFYIMSMDMVDTKWLIVIEL